MRRFDTLSPSSDRPVGHGFLNTLSFWVDKKGKQYIIRHPYDDRSQSSSDLEEELLWNGFTGRGGGFRYRTNKEQIAFARIARRRGLSVVPVLGECRGGLVVPWVEGEDLRLYLARNVPQKKLDHIVGSTFRDIARAHDPRRTIIYGDRWMKNIHFGDDGKVRHIDFDIVIHGPKAREFEVSQVIYSFIRDTKHIDSVVQAFRRSHIQYHLRHHDRHDVIEFMSRYAQWYGHLHPHDSNRSFAIERGIEQTAALL